MSVMIRSDKNLKAYCVYLEDSGDRHIQNQASGNPSSPNVFSYNVPSNWEIWLTHIHLWVVDDGEWDSYHDFAHTGAALTNGLTFQTLINSVQTNLIGDNIAIKTNKDLCDYFGHNHHHGLESNNLFNANNGRALWGTYTGLRRLNNVYVPPFGDIECLASDTISAKNIISIKSLIHFKYRVIS